MRRKTPVKEPVTVIVNFCVIVAEFEGIAYFLMENSDLTDQMDKAWIMDASTAATLKISLDKAVGDDVFKIGVARTKYLL